MRCLTRSICIPRLLAVALCSLSVTACSDDDPSTGVDPLQGQGGNAGSAGGSAGSGGDAGSGGTSNAAGQGGTSAGSAGSGAGGSAGAAGGSAGSAGAAGSAGSAGSGPDAGGVPNEPDAGDPGEPDDEETVTFSAVFPLLVNECGNCHGANAPGARPRFAVAGDEEASFDATELMSQNQLVSARIIARAVTLRTMPPGCNGGQLGTGACLTQDQADQLQAWFDDGAQP